PECRVERCAAGYGPLGDDFPIPLWLSVLGILRFRSDHRHSRMDSVPVIYVPVQTHLIYSAKHNSLTLFWGKVLVYLGYATKSRELQRLGTLVPGNSDSPSVSFADILYSPFLFDRMAPV
ncbi:hypothetical protein WN55_03738, partial [Dufourea novaeangliae]